MLVAIPAAALVVYLAWLGEWFFNGLIFFIAAAIQLEVVDIGQKAGLATNTWFVYIFSVFILLIPWMTAAYLWAIGLFLIFLALELFNHSPNRLQRLTATPFFGLYAPVGLMLLILIRNLGNSIDGFLLTIAIFLMMWGNDVFAYFGGKTFGARKMMPEVSPNKTWEGFATGFIGALVGLSIIMFGLPFDFPLTFQQAWPMVILTSIFGPVGDITESKLKRAANLKDSGTLLPGHGGFFDRFDALLLVIPAIYMYLQWLMLAGYASF